MTYKWSYFSCVIRVYSYDTLHMYSLEWFIENNRAVFILLRYFAKNKYQYQFIFLNILRLGMDAYRPTTQKLEHQRLQPSAL